MHIPSALFIIRALHKVDVLQDISTAIFGITAIYGIGARTPVRAQEQYYSHLNTNTISNTNRTNAIANATTNPSLNPNNVRRKRF
jgi:hypothetical protein